MMKTLFTMNNIITRTPFGILLFILLGTLQVSAIDAIKGVQPQKLASTLYSKDRGAGYQGAFFIKSPELIEIGNVMLKKSGVQYTLTNENTRGRLANYVTTEAAVAVIDTEVQSEALRSVPALTTSFSEVNQQVQAQPENATAAAIQRNGALFSDVSDLLQQ